MAKYSVPGIRFTEIDNTIRTESEPGLGIGAIVMKSNKKRGGGSRRKKRNERGF